MHRRSVLTTLAGILAGSAGCASLTTDVPIGYDVRANEQIRREVTYTLDVDRGDTVYLKIDNVRGAATAVMILGYQSGTAAGETIRTEREWEIEIERSTELSITAAPSGIADVLIGVGD